MPTDSQTVSQTAEPEQSGPSGFDLVRAEARAEMRDCFARMGMTRELATKLGLDLSALDEEDDD